MRHGTTNRRQRNRSNNGGRKGYHNRAQVFDSNGPDVRIRGTAYQVAEKYMALAKDAASNGDSIMEQNYLQHAEHYQRIINSWVEDVHSHRQPETSHRHPQGGDQASDTRVSQDDDLALPISILGPDTKQTSNAELAQSEELAPSS